VGDAALVSSVGSDNTALGALAGHNATTGSGNVYIGAAMRGVAAESNHTYIRNVKDTSVNGGGTDTVTVDLTTGLLGHLTSSLRYKEDIKPMDSGSEALYWLKPVTFRYKSDKTNTPQFGLIAEEVAEVNPDLVVREKEGKPYSVRYDAVNAMLLNEFLKEHRKVEEQEATITQLKKDFGATIAQLTARLDEQATQIQKVNTQLETSKPAPQVVNNP
jgi:hypothetical protein